MGTYNSASLNDITSNRTVSFCTAFYRCKIFAGTTFSAFLFHSTSIAPDHFITNNVFLQFIFRDCFFQLFPCIISQFKMNILAIYVCLQGYIIFKRPSSFNSLISSQSRFSINCKISSIMSTDKPYPPELYS